MSERPAGLVNKRRLRERETREGDHTLSLRRRRRRLRERQDGEGVEVCSRATERDQRGAFNPSYPCGQRRT